MVQQQQVEKCEGNEEGVSRRELSNEKKKETSLVRTCETAPRICGSSSSASASAAAARVASAACAPVAGRQCGQRYTSSSRFASSVSPPLSASVRLP